MKKRQNNPIFEFKPLGMRTIKTGLAVSLTLLLGQTGLIVNPLYAVIGTILGIQTTVSDSFQKGMIRVYGTVLGGIIGYLFVISLTPHPLWIGIIVIAIIYLCHGLNLQSSIPIAITVCASIALGVSDQNPLLYSLLRTTDTVLGVLVGLLVNILIAQPKPSQLLLAQLKDFHSLGEQEFQTFLQGESMDLVSLNQRLAQLDEGLTHSLSDRRLERNQLLIPYLKKSVETCHVYFFHLKCLNELAKEPLALSVEDRIILYEGNAHTDYVSLSSSMETLFDYHFKKLIQTQANARDLSKEFDQTFQTTNKKDNL